MANSEYGPGWQDYLGTNALRRELGKSRPDLSVLRHTLCRLSHEKALSAAPLEELRRALQGWLAWECLPTGRQLVSVADSILQRSQARDRTTRAQRPARLASVQISAPSKHELRARLTALLALLPWYADRPTQELAETIDRHLRWLANVPEAAPLVAAIRRYYSHPNIWFDVSEDFLDPSVMQRIDRWEDVRNVILGTPVSGRGHLLATSDLVVEPHPDQALFRIVLTGTFETDTVGRPGPARISTRAVTDFRVEKQVVLSAAGLKVLPAVCNAKTRTLGSKVESARRGLGAGLVRRVALGRWQALRDAAEQESSRHAERELKAAVDREADELIKKLDRLAVAPVLMLAGGEAGRMRVCFCSESRMLRIGAVYGPLGAPPNRPPHEQSRPLTLRVHAALLDRLRGSVAAGPSVLIGAEQWHTLAWTSIEKILSPRLTPYGVALRNGEWGTLVPVSLAGDWMAVEWRAEAVPARLAEAAAPGVH